MFVGVCVTRVYYRERVLANLAAADADNIGRIELEEHGLGLTCVDHEQDLMVAPLLPHLLDNVGQLQVRDLLVVLKF